MHSDQHSPSSDHASQHTANGNGRAGQADAKPRAILLLDTNILISLYASVSTEFKDDVALRPNPRRYLDMLAFLSHQGYEVIIPEMVAYEAENVLTSGKDIDSFFPRADHTRSKPYRRDLKKFLLDAVHGKRHPNIQVVPSDAPPHVAEFLDALHDIVDYAQKPTPLITNLLVNLHRKERKHYGDGAIEALLEEPNGLRSYGVPLFVLSDDREVLKKASAYKEVSVANSMGLIEAMLESGLWEGFGLSKERAKDGAHVMEDIDQQLTLLTGEGRDKHSIKTDHSAEDYSQQRINNNPVSVLKHPLTSSLGMLVHEMGWRKQLNTIREMPMEERPSAVEKFTQRYGADWQDKEQKRDNGDPKNNGHTLGGGR
jgi:hypothetical protein